MTVPTKLSATDRLRLRSETDTEGGSILATVDSIEGIGVWIAGQLGCGLLAKLREAAAGAGGRITCVRGVLRGEDGLLFVVAAAVYHGRRCRNRAECILSRGLLDLALTRTRRSGRSTLLQVETDARLAGVWRGTKAQVSGPCTLEPWYTVTILPVLLPPCLIPPTFY